MNDLENWAYVVGLALGDGNLSNSNGRAVRLRISCDTKYPNLIQQIIIALKQLLPNNKVHTIKRGKTNCLDVSCYSNQLEGLLGWKVGLGSKYKQRVSVPTKIKRNKKLAIACLRGLFQTDGTIYNDRGYIMAMFVTTIPNLKSDVLEMIDNLGFKPHCYKILQENPKKTRYNIRISKNTEEFIKAIELVKN